MVQVVRIGKYDPNPGSVMNSGSSFLSAIRDREEREQRDTVYNYRNYVVNKDYSYEIRAMQKYFYIFAVLEYPGISEKSVEKISALTGTNQNYIYPPEIIYNDD